MPLSTIENYNKNNVKWKKKPLDESSIGFVFKDIKIIILF
jgi:hypothetical protein